MTAKLGYSWPSRAFPKESYDSLQRKKRGERKKEDLIVAVDDQVSLLYKKQGWESSPCSIISCKELSLNPGFIGGFL